jgi:glycoside/pentoside/hexuronide:cation symporter, GPH family
MTAPGHRLPISEKIGYGSGDAAANLVWRGALAFLALFYTDTYGLSAVAVGWLLLTVRMGDGIVDIIMGMVADRTSTRWGKFRPWILWSAPVLGLFMVLTFTTPDLGPTGKLIWAYLTYIGLMLAYTANNVPYSALMGVMTPSNVERTNLSSWRFAGAFFGGFLVMVGTPLLVSYFGQHFGQGEEPHVRDQIGYLYTMKLFAALLVLMLIVTFVTTKERIVPIHDHSGNLKRDLWDLIKNLPFLVIPLAAISVFFFYQGWYSGVFFVVTTVGMVYMVRKMIRKEPYWNVTMLLTLLAAIEIFLYHRSLYSGIFLAIVVALILVFIKQIRKPASQANDTQKDLIDLFTNVPWIILLAIGFLFMMFNGIKIGATAYYFKHYIGDNIDVLGLFHWLPSWMLPAPDKELPNSEILTSVYFATVLVISIIASLCTGFLARLVGKKNLFVWSLLLSGAILTPIYWLGPDQIGWLFTLGIISEFFAAIMPVMFFTMLGDSADYSEWKNGRRATGLIYSAGTFINKTGGGFAGALSLLVLAAYGYNGMDESTIALALDAIKGLMSWIPSIFSFLAAAVMLTYPLTEAKMRQIESDLMARRAR